MLRCSGEVGIKRPTQKSLAPAFGVYDDIIAHLFCFGGGVWGEWGKQWITKDSKFRPLPCKGERLDVYAVYQKTICKANLFIVFIISMRWYCICNETAPEIMEER